MRSACKSEYCRGLVRWISIQAMYGSLEDVKRLTEHPDFLDWKNPNKVRSLIGGFARGNISRFHAHDGSGYEFIRESIARLDKMNPHVASAVARIFSSVTRLPPKQQNLVVQKVNNLLASHNSGEGKLSGETYEVLSKVANSVSSE
eukprot:gb/GECG01008348.1/.p1 GENE.gb/GECG01008348.1/~~gb/GECG01008348.1/.p1  ORF type:complete len:146 (+),score=17.68 gb/GECG01008348.1/:1-438(+)